MVQISCFALWEVRPGKKEVEAGMDQKIHFNRRAIE